MPGYSFNSILHLDLTAATRYLKTKSGAKGTALGFCYWLGTWLSPSSYFIVNKTPAQYNVIPLGTMAGLAGAGISPLIHREMEKKDEKNEKKHS